MPKLAGGPQSPRDCRFQAAIHLLRGLQRAFACFHTYKSCICGTGGTRSVRPLSSGVSGLCSRTDDGFLPNERGRQRPGMSRRKRARWAAEAALFLAVAACCAPQPLSDWHNGTATSFGSLEVLCFFLLRVLAFCFSFWSEILGNEARSCTAGGLKLKSLLCAIHAKLSIQA